MNKRDVDPRTVEVAKVIAEAIAKRLEIDMTKMQRGSRTREMCYARRLMVYLIRNETCLHHRVISDIVGFANSRPAASVDNFKRVKDAYRKNDRVKADVISLNNFIKTLDYGNIKKAG